MSDSETGEGPVGPTRLCRELLETWDSLFSKTVDPTRPNRMGGILDGLNAPVHSPKQILELGTGPGPLTARILRRLPDARVVGIDTDPVLLRVARLALRPYGSRVKLVLADLRQKGWATELPVQRFDAVVSSLTLHWLGREEIRGIYREARRLLRPNGVLLNGDYLPSSRILRRPAAEGTEAQGSAEAARLEATLQAFKRGWRMWWDTVRTEPTLSAAIQERRIRIPGSIPPRRTSGPEIPVPVESHRMMLRAAGFRQTRVTWQAGEMRVLRAVR